MATAHRDWHRRLTVIDDSPAMLELLGDVLRGDGAEIRLLDSDVTLQDLEGPVPDLLMIDLRLGGDRLRGLELIRDVRSHPALGGVPIVVCSAALDAIARHQEELQMIPSLWVLPKPFTLDDLESCVDEALGVPWEAETAS